MAEMSQFDEGISEGPFEYNGAFRVIPLALRVRRPVEWLMIGGG